MSVRRGQITRVTMPPPRIEPAMGGGESAMPERPLFTALRIVWRGRWIVVACTILGVIYGIYKVATFVPVYRSSSTIQITPPPTVLQLIVTNPNDTSGYLYTQCEIMHSTAILKKALDIRAVRETDCLRTADNPVGYLKNSVFEGPEKEGSLITVWMNSTNAQDAATIVNGVVEAYLAYQSEHNQFTAVEVMKLIKKSVDEQEADLKDVQRQLTDYKTANPELSFDNESKTGSLLQRKFNEAHQQTFEFSLAVEQAKNFADDPFQLKHVIDRVNQDTGMTADTEPVVDPGLMNKMKETRRLMRDLEIAGGINGDTYRRMQLEAQTQQHEFELEKAEASRRYLNFLNAQLAIATEAEERRKAALDGERKSEAYLNSKQAQYEALLQQKQETDRELENLYGKLKSVNIGQDAGSLTASVLEPARPAMEYDGPRRSSTLMMGIVGGLMLGLGGAVVQEMVEQRLRSVDEVMKLLAAPVLGSVPHILPAPSPLDKNVLRSPWLSYLKMAIAFNGPARWRPSQTLKQRGQIMHLQPRCDVAEAYRTIRTAIYFGLAGDPAKTILVTSPAAGDGKSTLVSNLAISIAQTGRRVLLIDADCWHPAQGSIFEMEEGPGLTEILQSTTTLGEVVKKTDIPNLDILLCGKIPENPAELIGGQPWPDLLAFASEQYDQILIDSPPVVPITDARILAASCGATILVLRADKSTRRQADEAFEALTTVGATILGIVVNDVVRQARGRSYQYYQYAANRGVRAWSGRGISAATAPRASNAQVNGHTKHLPEKIIEADITVDVDSSDASSRGL